MNIDSLCHAGGKRRFASGCSGTDEITVITDKPCFEMRVCPIQKVIATVADRGLQIHGKLRKIKFFAGYHELSVRFRRWPEPAYAKRILQKSINGIQGAARLPARKIKIAVQSVNREFLFIAGIQLQLFFQQFDSGHRLRSADYDCIGVGHCSTLDDIEFAPGAPAQIRIQLLRGIQFRRRRLFRNINLPNRFSIFKQRSAAQDYRGK